MYPSAKSKSIVHDYATLQNLRQSAAGVKRLVGGLAVVIVGIASVAAIANRSSLIESFSTSTRRRLIVFSSYSDGLVAKKQQRHLSKLGIHHIVLNQSEQHRFVADYCYDALLRYEEYQRDERQVHFAAELWKYCALSSGLAKTVAYLDLTSPVLLHSNQLRQTLQTPLNMAVLSSSYEPKTVHGSLLVFQKTQQSTIALHMLQVLRDTPIKVLQQKPLLLSKLLYALLAQSLQVKELIAGVEYHQWNLLEQRCQMSALSAGQGTADSKGLEATSLRKSHHCPLVGDYCCVVQDVTQHGIVMMNRHPINPLPELSSVSADFLPLPLNAVADAWINHKDLPYITTLQVKERTARPKALEMSMPQRFDDLLRNNCLPSDACNTCLAESDGCSECMSDCGCYCKTLCKETSVALPVTLRLSARAPIYHRDVNRLVPRIVHQTWYEPLDANEYPDSSRLAQSFRKSGWDYRFYTDADAVTFLETHFPPEVLQAYNALSQAHLQSHLFRYCVVFIFGGLFADIDLLLESAVELAIEPDVGFMAAMDEPTKVNSCLSKSFFAAAPGHPFLARAIETLVNQVRNRFSLVDMDNAYCPNPGLFAIRYDKASFVTGSCMLGTSVNRVVGRPPMFPFNAGELNHSQSNLPGRTIILKQHKYDMGGKRFTSVDRNLIVAVADVEVTEESDEHEKLTNRTVEFGGRFEFEALYNDMIRANEKVRIHIEHGH
ncbi:hypothetical protein MPSEU_000904600 [Mayamaea pseudoterrestris]|nr:hypothetical protein MPSEU_000904600 [Mayamaea pseudoterrestris]